MRRLRLLAALILVLCAFPWALPPAEAEEGCPLYYSCRWYIDSGCECDGFYCNDQFICGVPVAWP